MADRQNEEKGLALRGSSTMRPAEAFGEMDVEAVVLRKTKMNEILKRVMHEDKNDGNGGHYGVIPGTKKKSLLKAGAEVLCTTFALAPSFDVEQTDLKNGHREYRVVSTLTHIPTGAVVGEGVGCCSTMEKKYRYRAGGRKCPTCGQPTIRPSKYAPRGSPKDALPGFYCNSTAGGCGAEFAHDHRGVTDQSLEAVENADIADVYNTVLKMAKKRAQVDAVLTALGASDLFDQDREDEEAGDDRAAAATTKKPSPPAGLRIELIAKLDKIRKDDVEAFLHGCKVEPGDLDNGEVASKIKLPSFTDDELGWALRDAEAFMRTNPLENPVEAAFGHPAKRTPAAPVPKPSEVDQAYIDLVQRFETVRERSPAAAMEAIEARKSSDLDSFDTAKKSLVQLKAIVERAERLLEHPAGEERREVREPGDDDGQAADRKVPARRARK